MGIHVGSFTLGGIVGAGVMGYVIMKSPIGGEIEHRALVAAKKKAEEGIHFLLWGEDKKSPCYSDFIRYGKKGRPDYSAYPIVDKNKKLDEVYFMTEKDAKSVFSSIRDEIRGYGGCSIVKFLEVANEHMTKKSARELKMEYSDYTYGWNRRDLDYFDDEFFQTRYISGKGWQFWFPTVRKIGI